MRTSNNRLADRIITIKTLKLLAAGTLALVGSATAGDVVVGTVEMHGMEINAVYIQPVLMAPMLPGMGEADIHLEADIHATKDNQHGFGEGAWIPYLTISYTISKADGSWSTMGTFMPMSASDGPHYASNIKLDGVGKYQVSYHIDPPPRAGYYRHTDKETGVAKWWTPIDLTWNFTYLGYGKKGGY